jgi:hypothetical protein
MALFVFFFFFFFLAFSPRSIFHIAFWFALLKGAGGDANVVPVWIL